MTPEERALVMHVVDQSPWPVDHVHIGEPAVLADLFDARPEGMTVALFWRDAAAVRGWKLSIDRRGQRGAVAGYVKADPAAMAEHYRARARVGHAEIDSLSIGPHVTEAFELYLCPVPALLQGWLPVLGVGKRIVIGGMNLKPVEEAVGQAVMRGQISPIAHAGNCWLGVRTR